MTGSEASTELGVGRGQVEEPLRTQGKPPGTGWFPAGSSVSPGVWQRAPTVPPPQLSGSLAPAAGPQEAPWSPSPRGCVSRRDGDSGAPELSAPGVTGPGPEARISPREEGGCVFGLGRRLGNLRPVVSKRTFSKTPFSLSPRERKEKSERGEEIAEASGFFVPAAQSGPSRELSLLPDLQVSV